MSRAYRTVCVSGYFDPLHRGHVEYIRNAKLLGDKLIVILNTDAQRSTPPRIPMDDRRYILESLREVDCVYVSIDSGPDVCETLAKIKPNIFAKGLTASPQEVATCQREGIELVTGVGVNIHFHDLLSSLR